MSERVLRVGEILKGAIGEVLVRGLKDPRVTAMVSVTDVWVSGDLRESRVYVSIYGDERACRETMKGLRSSAGYVRREIARRVKLRATPTLEFVLDEGIERGAHVLAVMREAGIDVDGSAARAAAREAAAREEDDPDTDEHTPFEGEADTTHVDPPAKPSVVDEESTPTEPTMPAIRSDVVRHTTVLIDSADETAKTQPVPVSPDPSRGS